MLCVVIRTLRLCVSLRELFLPHAECAEIAEVCFVLLSELCVSASLCESFFCLTRRTRRSRRYALWCCQNSASLRLSARAFFASRGERRERGGLLCVGGCCPISAPLRSLRELQCWPHAEGAEWRRLLLREVICGRGGHRET